MERIDRIRTLMVDSDLDSFLISSPDNRRYFSGFAGSAGYLVITLDAAVLITDFRYIEQAGVQSPDFRVVQARGGVDWLPSLVEELGTVRMGFENFHMSVSVHQAMVDSLNRISSTTRMSLVATSGMLDSMRTVKDPVELGLISQAVELADQAFETVAPTIEVGQTEKAIAWNLEKVMREYGAEAVSFETIVASGPNSALPHHRPSDRQIREGEPIVMDFGARYQGYCSDMTRTVCVGEADHKLREIYDTVLAAQLTASATIRSGMTSGEADQLARTVIEEAGYGEHFGHALGHGIGLAVHEFPRVGPNATDLLSEGTVFTIEPGIYLPGWGGVRIEDTVVIDGGVVRPLTRSHKDERVVSH